MAQRGQIYPLSTGLAVGTPVQSPLPWRYYSTVLHCSLYCSLYCWKYYEYCTVLYCTVGDTTVQYCTVGDTYYRTVLYFLLCTGLYCWTLGPGRYHSGPVATATRRDVRKHHILAAGTRGVQGGQVGQVRGAARRVSGGAAREATRPAVGVGRSDEDC